MASAVCRCRCHGGEYHAEIVAYWGVPINDPVEKEVACSLCATAHLLGKPYPATTGDDFSPPTSWTPQADGSPEGRED